MVDEVAVVSVKGGDHVLVVVLEMEWTTGEHANILNGLNVISLSSLWNDKRGNQVAMTDEDDHRNTWRREDADDENYTHACRDEQVYRVSTAFRNVGKESGEGKDAGLVDESVQIWF